MDTFGRLYQGQPSGSVAELLYTVPADFSAIVKDVEAINISGTDDDITIWIVPPLETVDDEWIWRPSTTIAPGGSITFEGSKTLEEEVEIWAQCASGGGQINVIITGMEVDLTSNV